MIEIKVKKLYPDAKIPEKQTLFSAGADLYSISDVTLNAGEAVLVKCGIAVEIPEGYEMQIRPRSGLALNEGIVILNSPGTIDSDYRGEIGVIMYLTGKINWANNGTIRDGWYCIKKGDRIAQAVICKLPEVSYVEVLEELSNTERGVGGFGHTGVK